MSWDNNWGGGGGAAAIDSWGTGNTNGDDWNGGFGAAAGGDSFGAENGGNEGAGNTGGDRACFNCGESGSVTCFFTRSINQTSATNTVL